MNSPLRWHGGKHYLAPWIVSLMPKHIHYVEPYFGGGSVLLAKDPEGVSEVANDLCGDLSKFWITLQGEESFAAFCRAVEAVPVSENLWIESFYPQGDVDCAVQFFIRCRQSLAGRQQCFTPLSRNRTRRGMNEQAAAWLNAVSGLRQVHERLKRVVILGRPALDVIAQQDGPGTLFYLDPPYLPETRSSTGQYDYEMSEKDHYDLLAAIRNLDGHVMLSGYRSKLYDVELSKWTRHEKVQVAHSASNATKRRTTECVWCNF